MRAAYLKWRCIPNLCIDYIGQFMPGLVAGHRGLILGFAMIAICTAWNILGVRSVGEGSVWLNIALLAPFVALTVLALGSGGFAPDGAAPVPLRHADLLGGVLIAMWNYMGWDNLSTIAGEVETPQRTYSRAMFGAVLLVVVSYLIPVGAIARTGIDPNRWTTGGWVDIGQIVGGETLAIAIALAGVIGAIGSFGALMLSFTRLPLVMAEDGYLPRIFARRDARTGAPWCRHSGVRDLVGHLLSAGIREEPHSRRDAHGPEHPAGILGACGAARSRAGTCAAVPRSGRDGWSGGYRCSPAGADDCGSRAQSYRACGVNE